MHDPSADRELVLSLRRSIVTAVAPLLEGVRHCALVGFPNHNNSGDNAIWLGELRLLDHLQVAVAYWCDDASYHPRDLAEALPDGPILFHGGGNYGDLWPQQQAFRERVMQDFPDRPVVQMPQTVSFSDPLSIETHRRLLEDRDAPISILCRDVASARFVEQQLGTDPILCPDSALFLDLAPPLAPAVDVVVNNRADHESVGEDRLELPGLSVEWQDWLLRPGERNMRRSLSVRCRTASRALAARSHGESVLGRGLRRLPMAGSQLFAARRVDQACRLLSRGTVVITDRLHGHILCVLMGIPHVIRDTQYRKVANFHETFTIQSRTTFVVARPDDVVPLVHRLVVEFSDGR